MTYRTSLTHPLRIDSIEYPSSTGRIGLTLCPGKYQPDGKSGAWCRNLSLDLDRVRGWGASHVLTLIEDHEFERLRVERLPEEVRARGMQWHHLPIVDRHPPDHRFEQQWPEIGPELHDILINDGRILVHCMGGLGRAGTIATTLLIEAGLNPKEAVSQVREARRGAIETQIQLDWLKRHARRIRQVC
ncbi:cyclin-dependent kinase inhibitor 3 family protein [Gammaproteobacteria bacterium AB-CW1]|uniref:protein-tyrosine-phosphatase n=1 Tax=Natronospira elongata TaxID=3110268 RepID=A0AAP6JDB1_9GAMM|nr:cyclin-dependent kinase inhibitor 3 family protein [Gammaproteobacteria bacterium AB-CW1]